MHTEDICPRLPINMSTFTYQYVHVYLSICPRLPLRIYTHLNSMDISNEIIMCTYEQISSERQCPNER